MLGKYIVRFESWFEWRFVKIIIEMMDVIVVLIYFEKWFINIWWNIIFLIIGFIILNRSNVNIIGIFVLFVRICFWFFGWFVFRKCIIEFFIIIISKIIIGMFIIFKIVFFLK